MLWVVRTGAPWRDLPDEFGNWNSVFRRFSRWSEKGVWERMFASLAEDPDFEYLIIDSTIVRAHQHASGAKRGAQDQAIGAQAVIPNNPSRSVKHPVDAALYKERHLVECCFSRLKQFPRVATRYEKTARNYLAMVTTAAIILWLR